MPDWVRDRKKEIQKLYLDAASGAVFEDRPVYIKMYIYKKMPATSWSKKHKEEMHLKPAPIKPDVDNVIKLYLDALNGLAYKDDAQVVSISAYKIYDYTDSVSLIIQDEL